MNKNIVIKIILVILCIICFNFMNKQISSGQGGKIMVTTINTTPSQDLQTVINNCSNPSIYNQYNIVLSEGVYNVMNLVTKDYINIKGATTDRTKYWIKGERPNGSSDCGLYETITYKTTTILENLTITCKNMRYPYHNDGCDVNTQQKIINCHVEHLGNWRIDSITPAPFEESGWTSCHANGCGTSSGMSVYIENSHLIARQSGIALYAHNASNFSNPSHITANNCILEQVDGGSAVWMDGGANSGKDDLCTLINNTIIGGMWSNIWKFDGYGNKYDFFLNSANNINYMYIGTEHYKKVTNNSGIDISLGMACVFDGDLTKIRIMTSDDSISNFAGISSQSIPNNTSGYINFTAKILGNNIIVPSNLVIGDTLGIDPNNKGRFIKNTSKYVLTYTSDWECFGTNKIFNITPLSISKGIITKIDGCWKTDLSTYVKVDKSWKIVDKIYTKNESSWKG